MSESEHKIVSNDLIDLTDAKILYLTKNPELISQQLAGYPIGSIGEDDLLNQVSTDAYPSRACFRYDPSFMAQHALTGLPLNNGHYIEKNAVRDGHFEVLVVGKNFGMGSSREHFPWSLKAAGIRLVIAESIEEICRRNMENIGLMYLSGNINAYLHRLSYNPQFSVEEITRSQDILTASIVKAGGLLAYLKSTLIENLPKPKTAPRLQTGPEKIIAKKMGVDFVKPGDVGFMELDLRESYEIFFPMSIELLRKALPDSKINDSSSVVTFYDHSVLDPNPDAQSLGEQQRQIAKREGIKLYDGNIENGTRGICHMVTIEEYALPGMTIGITDSHGPTSGVIALPIPMGATEMAAALYSKRVKLKVPESILIKLEGKPAKGVMAKDIMLYLLSRLDITQVLGKICEYDGSALEQMEFDEQSVFPNMTAELGGFTSWVRPNAKTIDYLINERSIPLEEFTKMVVYSDPQANYSLSYTVDTSGLEPYVALPSNPRHTIPLSEAINDDNVDKRIDKVIIGSCTGGKLTDWREAASVLVGQKVHPDIQLFVYPASQRVKELADKDGLTDIIKKAGGLILPSACGACVNFGPGSVQKGERAVSTTNRNFPGRMGAGEVFLTNPRVAAASAIAGSLASPEFI